MQSEKNRATLGTKANWVFCPECKTVKLLRLPSDGHVRAYVYCRNCRRERFLDIDLSQSQRARAT